MPSRSYPTGLFLPKGSSLPSRLRMLDMVAMCTCYLSTILLFSIPQRYNSTSYIVWLVAAHHEITIEFLNLHPKRETPPFASETMTRWRNRRNLLPSRDRRRSIDPRPPVRVEYIQAATCHTVYLPISSSFQTFSCPTYSTTRTTHIP